MFVCGRMNLFAGMAGKITLGKALSGSALDQADRSVIPFVRAGIVDFQYGQRFSPTVLA